MEQKNNVTNSDYINSNTIKDKNKINNQNISKSGMKKFHSKKKIIIQKKLETNYLTIFNDTKKKQKQIKQCIYDLNKTKEQKEKNNKKESIKVFNTEQKEEKESSINDKDINIEQIKLKNKPKNIKVNKIKIEKNNKVKGLNISSSTNRGFYQKPNKNFNLKTEESTYSHKYLYDYYNDKSMNTNTNTNSKKTKVISVKTLSQNETKIDLLNDNFINSEYVNYRENSDFSLSDNNKNNNKYNVNTNTYSNTTTGKSKSKLSSSKILLSFKNIKTIYAHLEIFKCLYLKNTFKFFIEQLKKYKKSKKKISKEELYTELPEGNNFRPNNVNSHCSLFYSINLSQDKLFNTIYNNKNTNNTLTPLQNNENFENSKLGKSKKMISVNQENNNNNNINSSAKKKIEIIDNKSIYVPKKRISKSRSDIVNKIKTDKNVLSSKDIYYNRNSNNLKSPIKEMNINLKQINVCRLNDLNQLYLKNNFLKSSSGFFNLSDLYPVNTVNPIINIGNIINNNNRYSSNNILSINTDSNYNNNLSKEKYKLKKIQSEKKCVYIKPKDKSKKKKIKEIKIQNKLSPIRKDMENYKRNYNKLDNLGSLNNMYYKNKYMSDTYKINDINLNTINYNIEPHAIKKIYINRNSKGKHINNYNIKENILNYYNNNFYSTYLNFHKDTEKNINNNEFLVKQIITSDNRVSINIKYIVLINNSLIRNKKKSFNIMKFKCIHSHSITIINNKIHLNKDMENNILSYKSNNNNKKPRLLDIYSFDNIEGKIREKIKTKNISYSFKEYSISKEESHDFKSMIDNLLNFIKVLKSIIIKSIRKYLYKSYKKKFLLKKLLFKKYKKIIYFYFLKFRNKEKNIKLKLDKNGVYHKINYNDDFNLTKRLKSPDNNNNNNNKKNLNANPICRTKPYNLNNHNPTIQYNNTRNKINDKKKLKEITLKANNKNSNKYINKEINITVHNNISFNNYKKKIFLFKVKLISKALKKKNEI